MNTLFNTMFDGLTEDKKNYMMEYLKNAPDWFLESVQIVKKKKNTIFIHEGSDVENIYILMDGIVRAMDYRIFEIAYDYMWFYPVNVFGSMEILLKNYQFKTTLIAFTDCRMLVIPRSQFEKWILNDTNALQMEMQSICTTLLEQARKERVFLFLQGMDRLCYLLVQIYEQTGKKECVVTLTRKELSDRTGLCVKTINRSVSKLFDNEYIGRSGNKILISNEQYQRMKDYLKPLVEQC
ncbi:Crp/Fnr family transcriptional regulator [Anaeromicropila herbilytica]|uniref:Copper transporter n=1 Tax=Anaeromicropila herbilytica TaxID=2785025 RepID=A0A7R7EJT0_9FIRM|nr:Crp/Fnr family transcriptional regulator [Anaeromicropila herbilytica]BCN30087.1 copper transporter [Anaeromicropila herbilytica]